MKNITGIELKKNDSIPVLENAANDTTFFGKRLSYSLDGYELMEVEKKYALFLVESESDVGEFIPVGAIYGKVPLESSQDNIEFNGDEKEVMKVTKEAIKKYKK